ncbi:MAG TPA: acyltransferase [Fibrobacteria bacterium]|nr:acyltransferase [Fibrobacteria bacterium]
MKTDTSQLGRPQLTGELDWLTAIRFFAAAWVVVHHFGIWPLPPDFTGSNLITNVLHHGDLGVKFFFILSGFILVHVYGKKEKIKLRGFLWARAARIYPVYLFALILSLPSLLQQFHSHIAQYGEIKGFTIMGIKSIMVTSLTQAWFPSAALAWNGVSWSLSAEAFFYVTFPFLLPWLRKKSTRTLWLLLLGFVALDSFRYTCSLQWPNVAWGFTPLFRLPDFATGMVLRLVMDRGFRIPFISSLPFALGFIGLQCLNPTDSLSKILILFGTHISISLLVVSLAIPRLGTACPLYMRPLVLAGQVSYSVYLLQFPVMGIWIWLCPQWTNVEFGQFFAFLLLFCTATYYLVETPARNYIRARVQK